ncbi:homeodomain-like protein [Tanacetum coccineum]
MGNENVTFKSIKPTSSLIKRVYVLSLRERMKLDLEARLIGEALMINRSQDPSFEDFIELNDLNIPVELRRNQVEDLGPTISDGKVTDKPMIDIIKTRNNESFKEHPNFCDFDLKIHIDCAYNLKILGMIGFEHVNANFYPILSVNVMSKKFYNSIMKDKVEYKGKNVVGAFMNVPIFMGNFFVVTHFEVVENMDGYRDHDMGDVIIGEPFCKASCMEARRFDRIITIHNDQAVTEVFLGGTTVVEVVLVKGHLFLSILMVCPAGFDPLALVELVTPVEVNKVADLVVNGTWNWLHSWLIKAPILATIPASTIDTSRRDRMQWRDSYGNMKDFVVKYAWEELRPHGNDLWLVMRRALKTQDKLRTWDVDPTTDLSQLRCSLCGLLTDTHEHLFFECSYSSKVWCLVHRLAGMDHIQPVLEDVVNWFQPMAAKRTVINVVGKLLFAASVYFIWIERNQRLFKNIRRIPEELRDAIVITVRLKLVTFRFKNKARV